VADARTAIEFSTVREQEPARDGRLRADALICGPAVPTPGRRACQRHGTALLLIWPDRPPQVPAEEGSLCRGGAVEVLPMSAA